MTDTMIEKMARAICRKYHEGCGFPPDDAEAEADSAWPDWKGEARAALLAIREAPMDIGLIGAAEVNKQMRGAVKADYCAAQDSFTAMIDAILAGEA